MVIMDKIIVENNEYYHEILVKV